VNFCHGLNFQYKTEGEIEGLFRLLTRLFKLFYDLGMKDMSGVKGDDHADVVLEINPVAAFAADQLKSGFEQEFFRFGSGQSRQFRQCTPQGLR
jgi:hypothetical protein